METTTSKQRADELQLSLSDAIRRAKHLRQVANEDAKLATRAETKCSYLNAEYRRVLSEAVQDGEMTLDESRAHQELMYEMSRTI